jgi:alginate O-acetyltransferase complex protein AlgI
MLFSSSIFLFYFLPLLLFCYFAVPTIQLKNKVLLLFSLLFFAWGGIYFTLILILSIVFNFFIGLGIEKYNAKRFLIYGVTGNLALLVWFKYANFFAFNFNCLLEQLHSDPILFNTIILPIGISFYTFHSISYLIDVYHKKSPAQKNIFDMALYITLFSQLVAGPIIRYNTFAPQLLGRKVILSGFCFGIERFIIGLGKKVLIANTLARIANEAFQQDPNNMSVLLSWLGALCYTFQIYFDFSGYSDMAIGLSKLFGFEFPENFNLPYIASSIKDFWKRWHISLSSFFRDYVYIPLGGNKKGNARTYLNLILVFFLTGFWHGANYTFIFWGMLHGSFLLIERAGFDKVLLKVPLFLRRTYTFMIVLLAWIPFRADTIQQALNYYRNLLPNTNDLKLDLVSSYFTTDLIIALVIAVILSFDLFGRINLQKTENSIPYNFFQVVNACFLLFILFFSMVYLMSGTYNPFIYYQF